MAHSLQKLCPVGVYGGGNSAEGSLTLFFIALKQVFQMCKESQGSVKGYLTGNLGVLVGDLSFIEERCSRPISSAPALTNQAEGSSGPNSVCLLLLEHTYSAFHLQGRLGLY